MAEPVSGSSNEQDLLKELDNVLSSASSTPDRGSLSSAPIDVDLLNGIADMNGSPARANDLYEKYCSKLKELERLEDANLSLSNRLLDSEREKEMYLAQLKELNSKSVNKVNELDRKLLESDYTVKSLRDRMLAQEKHHKKSLAHAEAKHVDTLKKLQESEETAQRDKDTAVVRYAIREKEVLDLQTSNVALRGQLEQLTAERDALHVSLRAAKNDKHGMQEVLAAKTNQIDDLQRELSSLQAAPLEAEARVKVAMLRVGDVEAEHETTRAELEQTCRALAEAREETATIRANCQQMIKKYQESEEFKSNSLAKELQMTEQEKTVAAESYDQLSAELTSLKTCLDQVEREKSKLKQQISSVTDTLAHKDSELSVSTKELGSLRAQVAKLETRAGELQEKADQLDSETARCSQAETLLCNLKQELSDAQRDSRTCQQRTEEALASTQRVTARNAELQAECVALQGELSTLTQQHATASSQLTDCSSAREALTTELAQLRHSSAGEIARLTDTLETVTNERDTLSRELCDERNAIAVLRRKHASALREMKNELRRRGANETESVTPTAGSVCSGSGQSAGVGTAYTGQIGRSRTSSIGSAHSLQSLGQSASGDGHPTANGDAPLVTLSPVHSEKHSEVVSLDSTVSASNTNGELPGATLSAAAPSVKTLVEKIVKLQRLLARRTEKIEFMEEHVRQLVQELQNKTKIIQQYALRDEAGSLTTATVDANKADLTKRGHTLMGSLFSGHHTGADLTLDLAMQINKKLQAVLEDALLKNITYKENLETLGTEISALERENRQLKTIS